MSDRAPAILRSINAIQAFIYFKITNSGSLRPGHRWGTPTQASAAAAAAVIVARRLLSYAMRSNDFGE